MNTNKSSISFVAIVVLSVMLMFTIFRAVAVATISALLWQSSFSATASICLATVPSLRKRLSAISLRLKPSQI